ncbi:MAG: TonB-dependent receptor [Ignavibacteriales bacterium]|nr:TonB-dependent receptor [Ignavibacteriales bacterium]
MSKTSLNFLGRLLVVSFLLFPVMADAGQTGKIAGRILDAATNEPLIGANVSVKETSLGTITDIDGYYTINNIPPGKYSVVVGFIGYRKFTMTDVIIKIDLTTQVNANLQTEAILSDEVVVMAERPIVQKDLTSSSVTVSSEELKRIPTESISQVINIQAGVVGGHFRGGRSGEVAYLIDGVSVNDPYNGSMPMQIDNSVVREMEVISGTFNAEYGQAMSGIVNVVTSEGSSSYHGSISAYTGEYATSHTDIFPNNGSLKSLGIKNIQGNLSGYIPFIPNLTFFVTGMYSSDRGYLYGQHVYDVSDQTPIRMTDAIGNPVFYTDNNGNPMYDYPVYVYFVRGQLKMPASPSPSDIAALIGNPEYVAMNPSQRRSLSGKLAYSIGTLKFVYNGLWDDNWNKYYDHSFAWTPDGIQNHYRTDWIHSFQITHSPTANTYQTLKFGYNWYDYKGYLYENPFNTLYVNPDQGAPTGGGTAYTFRTGGNQTNRYDRYSKAAIAQYSFSSQINNKQKIGVGVEWRAHELYSHSTDLNSYMVYPDLGAPGNQFYLKKPTELSAYVQDKIEYDMMIINLGIRFDQFDPASSYPMDLKNPTKNPLFPYPDVWQPASKKTQLSPRFGISFPITDQGIIHFSYGHFFQIPSFDNLYRNSDYLVPESSTLNTIAGNPDLEPQRTTKYELGLQQVLFTNVGLDLSVYYSDIRNLLGAEIIHTYEGRIYARLVNHDYGNVKGFILSLDRRFSDFYGVKLDYTYQLASGNASDPLSVYNNNQTDPPIETPKTAMPLDWDQRSTLNLSFTVGKPEDWNVGLIFSYGSGFPYTEDTRVSSGIRFENGGLKPSSYNVDMRAEKTISLAGGHITLFALIYNLLDTKNEVNVNAASGRANIDLYTYRSGPIVGLNTIQQYLNNPQSYSAPRQVRLGFRVDY